MKKMKLNIVRAFSKMESTGGILLLVAAAIALILANSAYAGIFEKTLQSIHDLTVGSRSIAVSVRMAINDGLMTLFFLLIGGQLKQEWVGGKLSLSKEVLLPASAALGGMLIPALIYWAVSAGHPVGLRGWAIPTATDIAFSLGVLSLFGRRIPTGLVFFLMLLAILDDAGAVLIIGLFYTGHGSGVMLGWAAVVTGILYGMGRLQIMSLFCWGVGGLILWFCLLRAGVHPVLAGVLLAMMMPAGRPHYPVERLVSWLHPWVAFVIMPLFALANAGVPLQGKALLTGEASVVSTAIMAGLFLGKPLGIMGFSSLLVWRGKTILPHGVSWGMFLGTACLCGIGFTMSLFIGTLAFENHQVGYTVAVRQGVLLGSLLSGLVGALILHMACRAKSGRVS